MTSDMRLGDTPGVPQMTVLTAQPDNTTGSAGLLRLLGERYETPQARGKAFERIMQQAFGLHPDVYGPQRFKRVWLWMEWPDRQAHGYGADVGIDLVAEQTEAAGGGLCAIQAKAHLDGRINKAAVDSFISASAGAAFSARLLVLTAPLTNQARTMVEHAVPRCEVLYRSDLESWPVNWAECLDDPSVMRFVPRPRHTPKPFQTDAVSSVLEGLGENDRGRLVMPCGTGKSVVSLWIAERFAGCGGRVLYLVPSIALMNQTMREWAAQRDPDIPHRYIGVCSDTRAGHTAEDAPLAELAMPVTTDPQRIASQFAVSDSAAMTVVFCTYQSLSLIADAQAEGGLFGAAPEFDLVLCDEAHRTTGIEAIAAPRARGAAKRAGTPYSFIHDPMRVKSKKRLYMTATPRIYAEAVRRRVEDARGSFDIYSMDDEVTYGPEMYRMSFGEAVEGGHLTDYKVLVIAVAENPMLEAYDSIVIDEDRPFSIVEAVRFAGCWDGLADPTTTTPEGRVTGAINAEHGARRAIAFTNRIKSSERVERYWTPVVDAVATAVHGRPTSAESTDAERLLQCEVRHVDGSKHALERADTIAWLRQGDPAGACRIVTNARCLTEGIDVPALDAVIFLEPKQSQIDVIQAVGRVMRRSADKKVGYVILPVVVPSGASLLDDKVLSGSDFKAVWKVLKALRSHDERLDVEINTADLTGRPPLTFRTTGLCDTCGKATAECKCDKDDTSSVSVRDKVSEQRLPFEHAIASRLVKACGDRQYWDRWGREVARITDTITGHIRVSVKADSDLADKFNQFSAQIEATIGGRLPAGGLSAMVAQHVVTMPVFDALFAGSGFADRNPISMALNELLDEFKAKDIRLRDETVALDRFYDSVRTRLSGAADSDARLTVMLEVYESFFKEAMSADVQRLGIVYTPIEVVDFILRSADAVLRKEFGRGLTSDGVHILDPFTGTGTFINRLLTQTNSKGEPLITDTALAHKFTNTHSPFVPGGTVQEIHANEIVLLAYYLAAIKIEEGYRDRTGNYQPFSGLVLTDTYAHDPAKLPGTGSIGYNSARAKQQDELPIQVIVANPPWSAGQKSSGDDNPRPEYPEIEQRVRDTYGKRHKEITGRGAGPSSGNLYVEAFRWACDRLDSPDGDRTRPGIVAFVHPNSLSNAPSLLGMRAALREEFSDIYVANLLGDAMKSGDEYHREGDKVFGQGSRSGVQVTVLVRNPDKDPTQPAALHYATVPEYSTRDEKFAWLGQLEDVTSDQFETVPVNDAHHWINLTDGSFDELLPVCAVGKTGKNGQQAALVHALGAKTNCDTYVYSFTYDDLVSRMTALIDAYEHARHLVSKGTSIEDATRNDELEAIKWTHKLKQSLKNGHEIEFDEARIREVLYRPFTKLWLYEDHRILSQAKATSDLFPRPDAAAASPPPGSYLLGITQQPVDLRSDRDRLPRRPVRSRDEPTSTGHPTEAIMISSASNMTFQALATDTMPDIAAVKGSQQTRALPRWRRSC